MGIHYFALHIHQIGFGAEVCVALKVRDVIIEKVSKLISQFKSEDLEVIEQDDPFESNKKYVQRELDRLNQENQKARHLNN